MSSEVIAEFLSARRAPVATGCKHAPVVLGFRVQGDSEIVFRVALTGPEALLQGSEGPADYWVRCTERELEDLLSGRSELMARFWAAHLPLEFEWAPSLSIFLFAERGALDLNPVIREVYTTSRYYPTITPFPQGQILHSLVLEHDLRRTLEVGLAFGGSALFFCAAHATRGVGQHIALDPYQQVLFEGEGVEMVQRAGLDGHFTWLAVKAQRALPALARAGMALDLIYIDGDHSLPAVLSDFLMANALLRTGGLLALDDSHFPSGERLIPILERDFPYETLRDRSTDRLTVMRKRGHTHGPVWARAAAVAGRAALAASERRRVSRWGATSVSMKSPRSRR